jgi:hypothetical protein
MLELLLSTILAFFVPSIVGLITGGSVIINNILFLIVLCLVALISNVVSAKRLCSETIGKSVSDGLKQGLVTSSVTVAAFNLVALVPALRVPFTVISVIPGLAPWVDSFIMSVFYLISNLVSGYIWTC